LTKLCDFYNEKFTALRQLNYIGKQKAEVELLNIFLDGGSKYNTEKRRTKKGGSKKHKKRKKKGRQPTPSEPTPSKSPVKNKWKKAEFNLRPNKVPLLAFGDAMFSGSMRGKKTGLVQRCRKLASSTVSGFTGVHTHQ
jgi:hypothetical protein